uniref:GST N-terminal domain-containing protein n=1 Tax=Sus scrofa TaxID=9823 RepID=A0A8D1IAE2_PIG
MTMILGYWDIRGLAHAIRLLLEYTDSSYEEKKYTMGDGNGILFCSGRADSGQACHVLTPVARLCQAPPAATGVCPFPNPLGVQLATKAGRESPCAHGTSHGHGFP